MSVVSSILNVSIGGAFAAKAGVVIAVLALGAAMTLSGAEASDEWGDSFAVDGFVDGDPGNALGDDDDVIVQIGTSDGGGSIVINFDGGVSFDGPGADLRIHTLDTEAPALAQIEVSRDGVSFVSFGNFRDDEGDIDLNLADQGLQFATAVRITHVSADQLPGFDLDAVTALNHVDLENVTLALTPLASTSPGYVEHVVTATLGGIDLTDGIPVSFEVAAGGPHAGAAGISSTNALNQATFAWVGDNSPGVDLVDAWLDINGNGALDVDEPSAVNAVHEWYGATGTLELIDVDANGLVVGDLVQVIVEDRDLDVTDSPDVFDIVVVSGTDGAGITVELTETGDHTGIFTGLFTLGETSDDAADVLAAVDGDDITAAYLDELDGEGNEDVEVTVSLAVVAIEEEGAKATICHRPPGNPGNQKTLSVGSSAVPAHLGHGDTIGECGESDVLSKQEEQQELKDARDAEREHDRDDRDAQREQDRLDREAAVCEKKGGDHPRCEAGD